MRVWLSLAVVGLCLVPSQARGQANLFETIGGCKGAPPRTTRTADPSNYLAKLSTLAPGERLLLAPGIYPRGLRVHGLNGNAGACIVIEGPATGQRAVFTGRNCCNTVSIRDASYIVIRGLELEGQGLVGDAVKAEFESTFAHHITLENLHIHGNDRNQLIIGISTKSPAWNWVIRHSVIDGAGTGIYLGDSNGEGEFVRGLIEHNLIRRTRGYNMQIKHQNRRNIGAGMPASATTIIRHNVFSKAQNSSTWRDAQPNLLVGHWPRSGPGSSDTYQIYGNLFYQNPTEALFQGEGHLALHDNLFIKDQAPGGFPAIAIQPHNDLPKTVEVFHNTVVAFGTGIKIVGVDASFRQRARANAVFSAAPNIVAPRALDNVVDLYENAGNYLVDTTSAIGAGLELFPLAGALVGAAADLSGLTGYEDWDRDYNGTVRNSRFRGAYAEEGTNPARSLTLATLPAHAIAQRLDERIGDYLAEEVRSRGIPGLAAAVMLDEEVLYIGAFGVRRLGSGEALTPEHVFHFASVSKPFVATAIVQLVEQGRLSLDDAVVKHLPYFRLSDERFRDITIRQMLNHTSGMPDVEDYEWDRPQLDEGAAERYVRSIASEGLLWAPGENWRYSNMAFDVLGDVIAKVSGESFEAYIAANILEPLGMDRSSFIYPEIDEALRTSGHVGEPSEVSGVYPYNRRHAPSSTLSSSVAQMTRWILVNLRRGELEGRRILRDASYELL